MWNFISSTNGNTRSGSVMSAGCYEECLHLGRRKQEEAAKLNNKLYYSASSPIILVIKSLRMWWVGQAACMDNKPNAYSDSVVTPKEKDPLENPGTNWRKTLTWILKNRMWGCGMDLSGSNMTNDGLPWTQFHTSKCKGKDFHVHTVKTYKRSRSAPHILNFSIS